MGAFEQRETPSADIAIVRFENRIIGLIVLFLTNISCS
jgi:hypothetical protein